MENKGNANELMNKVVSSYKSVRELNDKIYSIEDDMKVDAFKILDELKKIDGWEVMIESCRGHYEQYPNEFFSWCEPVVYGTTDNPMLVFEKGYSGDDTYDVLTIDLNTPLDEQVNRKLDEIKKSEQKELEKKRKKEYNEYLRLKKKFETE